MLEPLVDIVDAQAVITDVQTIFVSVKVAF